MSEDRVTLDHIANISVDADKHINSLNVLRSLRIGMFNLAEFTRKQEVLILEDQDTDTVTAVFKVTDETLFIGCLFDWFAVSLVSYLRLAKLIDLMELNQWGLEDLTRKDVPKEIKASCLEYIKSVAPGVYKWRNKIAAHRVATDPRTADSLTLLTYSTMPTVDYRTPYYGVLNLRMGMSNGGRLDLEQWSLTKTFEDLAPRLWPEVRLTPLPYK